MQPTIVTSALRKGRGGVWISVQNGAGRALQLPEMWFVRPPLVSRLTVDWPPHLLGTWSPDSPFSLVEFEHLGFEIQPAILEQRPNLGFRVLDHSLIKYAVNAARKNLVDMRHQANIIGIVTPKRVEVVGEVLAARKMLAVIGHATGQRMPPRVDDLGVRQDQVD